MKEIGVKQARQQLRDLLQRVEAGEEIMITRQGKAVAKLVSAPRAARQLPSLEDFRHRIGRRGTPAAELLREQRNVR